MLEIPENITGSDEFSILCKNEQANVLDVISAISKGIEIQMEILKIQETNMSARDVIYIVISKDVTPIRAPLSYSHKVLRRASGAAESMLDNANGCSPELIHQYIVNSLDKSKEFAPQDVSYEILLWWEFYLRYCIPAGYEWLSYSDLNFIENNFRVNRYKVCRVLKRKLDAFKSEYIDIDVHTPRFDILWLSAFSNTLVTDVGLEEIPYPSHNTMQHLTETLGYSAELLLDMERHNINKLRSGLPKELHDIPSSVGVLIYNLLS